MERATIASKAPSAVSACLIVVEEWPKKEPHWVAAQRPLHVAATLRRIFTAASASRASALHVNR